MCENIRPCRAMKCNKHPDSMPSHFSFVANAKQTNISRLNNINRMLFIRRAVRLLCFCFSIDSNLDDFSIQKMCTIQCGTKCSKHYVDDNSLSPNTEKKTKIFSSELSAKRSHLTFCEWANALLVVRV